VPFEVPHGLSPLWTGKIAKGFDIYGILRRSSFSPRRRSACCDYYFFEKLVQQGVTPARLRVGAGEMSWYRGVREGRLRALREILERKGVDSGRLARRLACHERNLPNVLFDDDSARVNFAFVGRLRFVRSRFQ